jgi:transposase
MDVHKKFLVATIIKTNGENAKYTKKRFSTFNGQLRQLKDWLLTNNCRDVCMESTGKYWVPIYNILEGHVNLTVANPKWVKAVAGNKDDAKDSKWIGDLFRMGLVPGSFVPPKPIRVLRELTRYRFKLVGTRSSERNRYQNCFTVCNVALDAVVSDMFGKSALNVTGFILNHKEISIDDIKPLLNYHLTATPEDVFASVEGYIMTQEQKQRAKLVLNHHDYLDTLIARLDAIIDKLVKPYESAVNLLCTIPGVSRQSAIKIIAECGTDMSQFQNSRRFCNWAGLTPGNNESAGKKFSVHIRKAGVYIKPALVEVAHAAVSSKERSYYRVKFERISKRTGKKRAYIAIARMILTAIYHMLSTGEIWNPVDLAKIDKPFEIQKQQAATAVIKAAKLLVGYGLINEEFIEKMRESPPALIPAKSESA